MASSSSMKKYSHHQYEVGKTPIQIVFPRNLLGGMVPGLNFYYYIAIPTMLLALILCFDHRKTRDVVNLFYLKSSKGHKYIWYALHGYAIGLVSALAAGVLTHSLQPALLYLVPSTLGPVIFMLWRRKDLRELWEGPALSNPMEKSHEVEI
ncbi:unnamed protein product [Eruca vesicaria subsp. sativa]|uniref:Uncharacterized protein n=1 Tax=Eruca vesicaria subsp. sativa TaxID=29727 RepID=A0ABC8J0M6_ERUVS|nr:unnamed protein product [Eruca vesicaria subsp. sativa]